MAYHVLGVNEGVVDSHDLHIIPGEDDTKNKPSNSSTTWSKYEELTENQFIHRTLIEQVVEIMCQRTSNQHLTCNLENVKILIQRRLVKLGHAVNSNPNFLLASGP